MSNRLLHESSPYLLQHAHNPVDWYPYGEEAFEKAGKENKPLLFSIGYSSCHWCHVMEKESFENEEIAGLMNEKFICVKVDREERPDVDHFYMDAVQLLHGSGGWPLNCFALPDGRPFWGGTYFRPDQWRELLEKVSELYKSVPNDLRSQADELALGIAGNNLYPPGQEKPDFTEAEIQAIYSGLETGFDPVNGGFRGAPKFPMPVVLKFLLQYYSFSENPQTLQHVLLSLRRMAMGGIFDQAGGGFARYSVDNSWKVPHFEKMLYDNAQLIDLYTDAYKITKDDFFRKVAESSLEFIRREMSSPEGLFYSSLDADTEGEEGRYYTWTAEEFEETLGPYAKLMAEYYGLGAEGEWEKNRNILLRPMEDDLFAQRHFLSLEELTSLLKHCRSLLMEARNKRPRPALDDKALLSWNALMIKCLVNASLAFDNLEYLKTAGTAADFLVDKMIRSDGGIFHTWKNGEARIAAFLEDYALLGQALLALFQASGEERWLELSLKITRYAFAHFHDPESGLFYFSEDGGHGPARKLETYDGVIPSSNSAFAELMHSLGTLTDDNGYLLVSGKMPVIMHERIVKYPSSHANWAGLALSFLNPARVIAVVGPEAGRLISQMGTHYLPGALIIGSNAASDRTYFLDRFVPGKTLIYICSGNTCLLPVEDVESALKLL